MKALALFFVLLSFATPDRANAAQDATSPCIHYLRLRDSIGQNRLSNDPMRLSLSRSAGSDTVGTVDAAVLGEAYCDSGSNSELQYYYGADYHYDSNRDLPVKKASIAGGVSWFFDASEVDASEVDAPVHSVSLDASVGRNFEADRGTSRVGVEYASTRTNDQFWLFGSEIGAGRGIFSHEIVPRIEYSRGYQPSIPYEVLAATWSMLRARADWFVPFGKEADNGSTLKLFARWDGGHRLSGDNRLPSSANSSTIGAEWQFTSTAAAKRRESKGVFGVSLNYNVGRSPQSDFVRDEMVMLQFTYSFDRHGLL